MAGGGKRPRAGRPARLKDASERIWCYAECFVVGGERQCERVVRYWDRFKRLEEYEAILDARAKLEQFPVSARALLLADDELPGALERKREEIEDALDAADHAGNAFSAEVRKLTHGRSCPRTSPRFHRLPRFCLNVEVFEEVARRACERFGRRITATEVQTNWKFMRGKLTSRNS